MVVAPNALPRPPPLPLPSHKLRLVTSTGAVTTIAGGGASGGALGVTNGVGTSALFKNPRALAVAASGTLYVADYGAAAGSCHSCAVTCCGDDG